MAETQHPWQSGPTELITFALEHLHKSSDFDHRVAFLLLDVGVETLFKTFLTLPDRTTKTTMPYPKRREAAEGGFHSLCDGIEKAAGDRLKGVDIAHVQFYHDLRNRLYHQGNGITIPTDKAQKYAELAVDLLMRLLEIDLSAELRKPELEARRLEAERAEREQAEQEIQSRTKTIESLRNEIGVEAAAAIERVFPELTLPSVASHFQELLSAAVFDYLVGQNPIDQISGIEGIAPTAMGQRLRTRMSLLSQELNLGHRYESIIELDLDILHRLICRSSNADFSTNNTWVQQYRFSEYYPDEPFDSEYWFVFRGEDGEDWADYRTGRRVAQKPTTADIIRQGDSWIKNLNIISEILKLVLDNKIHLPKMFDKLVQITEGAPLENWQEGRYDALSEWLRKRPEGEETLNLKFDEIEKIIGQALPASAQKYREWWANHSKNSSGGSWLRGGWRVKNVSFQDQVVSFQRTRIGLVQPFFLDVMSRVKQVRPSISWETKNRMTQDWRLTTDRPRFYFYWIFEPEVLEMQFFVGTDESQVNDLAYQRLFEKRDEIETQVGAPLNWQQLSDNLECRITASYPAQITDSAPDRERAKQWLIGMTLKFLDTFEPLIPHL